MFTIDICSVPSVCTYVPLTGNSPSNVCDFVSPPVFSWSPFIVCTYGPRFRSSGQFAWSELSHCSPPSIRFA